MTIASEITRLQWAKADIKTAIESKWVTVPASAKLDTYDTYIDQIQQWWDVGWITITSSESFINTSDARDSATISGNISITNWNTVFWVIWGFYTDERSESGNRYSSVVLWIWRTVGEDFVFRKLSWTTASSWWWWHVRVLSDWNTIKILTSYYERTWTDNTDTAEYDVFDIDPSNMTVVYTWTWIIERIPESFSSCPASTFWYSGFTDFSWPVPWYENGRFNNLQFNSSYYPTFKLV